MRGGLAHSGLGGGAGAAFPGKNGRIAFDAFAPEPGSPDEIFTMEPDWTGQRRLTNTTAARYSSSPSYSPDGTKIAWERVAVLPHLRVDGDFGSWTPTAPQRRGSPACRRARESPPSPQRPQGRLSDKGPDGRRYVYLYSVADSVTDNAADTSANHARDALICEMRAHDETLREQLEAERQTHSAEARRLLAAALERIPAIEAPQEEAVDAAETGGQEPEESDPRSTTGGAREPVQRPQERSWSRRMFGSRGRGA
jgi:hypothetical protein